MFERAKAYEDAGAIAIEVELVPSAVAAEISKRLRILTVAMGAGSGCDAQYLFAMDILGYNAGHVPRHAKEYRNHGAEYQRLYEDSVAAFREFHEEVQDGRFPTSKQTLSIDAAELEAFRSRLDVPAE